MAVSGVKVTVPANQFDRMGNQLITVVDKAAVRATREAGTAALRLTVAPGFRV